MLSNMNLRRIYVEIIMSLMFVKEFVFNLLRFVNMGRKRYLKNSRLDGKVVVITGANTGIGKETAYQLSLRGAKIVMCCRNVDRGLSAAKDIVAKNSMAVLEVLEVDLSSLSSVRQSVRQLKQKVPNFDILINNAGVMMCPKHTTEDGFELQFASNHLGHFLLTLSLIENMNNSSDARIITVSSMHAMRGQIYFSDINLDLNYSPLEAYCQSKLANILFSRQLAERVAHKWPNIKTYALHPGTIRSDLFRHLTGITSLVYHTIGLLFNIDCDLGIQTTLYCALDEDLIYESGFYYSNCQRIDCLLDEVNDERSAQKLWQLSERMVRLEDKYKI